MVLLLDRMTVIDPLPTPVSYVSLIRSGSPVVQGYKTPPFPVLFFLVPYVFYSIFNHALLRLLRPSLLLAF